MAYAYTGNRAQGGFSGASVNVASTVSQAAGNCMIVCLFFRAGAVPSVTPPAGAVLLFSVNNGSTCGVAFYMIPNAASGTPTYAFSFSPSVPSSPITSFWQILECTGFGTTVNVDQHNTNTGQSTSPTVTLSGLTQNPSFAIGGMCNDNAANDGFTSGTGLTIDAGFTGGNCLIGEKNETSTSNITFSATLGHSTDHWAAGIANIYSPGGAGQWEPWMRPNPPLSRRWWLKELSPDIPPLETR